jgi:LysR family transcriptional regulator, transcriptional activator of nhaA
VEWINYHHLLYFWAVARHGSVTEAAKQLGLAQPTVTGQIRALEVALDEKLFERAGRNLVLTDVGRIVYRYADEIFSLGKELRDTLKGRPTGKPLRLSVGVSDAIPKLIVSRLLTPALTMDPGVHLICREDKTDRLLAGLSVNDLDLVLADEPLPAAVRVRAYNHLLGESPITFFGAQGLAERYASGFPESLDGAPLLLPTVNTAARRAIDYYFVSQGIRPRVIVECEDTALLKAFGEQGVGIFVGPSVIESDIIQHFRVQVVGRAEQARERFYAITVERRIKHPAVALISQTARAKLFGQSEG